MLEHSDYWATFYRDRRSEAVPDAPSDFARWTRAQLAPEQPLVEVGFGTARDSLWFARNGHPVRGYDYADPAVTNAAARGRGEQLPVTFESLDLYDADATRRLAVATAERLDHAVIYGRFLIHSLEDPGRHHLFDAARDSAVSSSTIFLEFRTGKDADQTHVFGDSHYRNYLDPAEVENELRDRGAEIMHIATGHGFAVYKDEDPHVARIVARWKGRTTASTR